MLKEIYEIKAFGKLAALLLHTSVNYIVIVQCFAVNLCFVCQEINVCLAKLQLLVRHQKVRLMLQLCRVGSKTYTQG